MGKRNVVRLYYLQFCSLKKYNMKGQVPHILHSVEWLQLLYVYSEPSNEHELRTTGFENTWYF